VDIDRVYDIVMGNLAYRGQLALIFKPDYLLRVYGVDVWSTTIDHLPCAHHVAQRVPHESHKKGTLRTPALKKHKGWD